jgi:hypothetical protein
MRVIKLVEQDASPSRPGQTGQKKDDGHRHDAGGHRCISPFFGLYVAVGICAAAWAGWKILWAILS